MGGREAIWCNHWKVEIEDICVDAILFLIDNFLISKIQIALTKEEFDECCTNGKQIGNVF